jgi:hypothetical protein
MNKHKGQLGFPLKTKSPSGATAGGNPPPPKMVPFFRKKPLQMYQVRLDPSSGELTRDTSG